MAFHETLIAKRKAARLLGYCFERYDVIPSDPDCPGNPYDEQRSLTIFAMRILNTGYCLLNVVISSIPSDSSYRPDDDFCFDCALRKSNVQEMGKESLKDFTGYTVEQLIELVRKAEASEPTEIKNTGIHAGATVAMLPPCPSGI